MTLMLIGSVVCDEFNLVGMVGADVVADDSAEKCRGVAEGAARLEWPRTFDFWQPRDRPSYWRPAGTGRSSTTLQQLLTLGCVRVWV